MFGDVCYIEPIGSFLRFALGSMPLDDAECHDLEDANSCDFGGRARKELNTRFALGAI